MARRKSSTARDTVQIKGFARLALQNAETGAVEWESGWVPNALTDIGFQHYLVGVVGGIANSSRPAYIALATQTAAATTTQDDPSGPFGGRKAATFSFSANGTLQGTASWDTNEATGSNIGALSFYATDTGGSCANVALLAATTSKSTAQTLSASLQWRFSAMLLPLLLSSMFVC